MISSQTDRVLVIDDFHPVFSESLEKAGISCRYFPNFDPDTDAEILNQFEIIAVRSKLHFTSELLLSLPHLKCIARGGAGMDNIDQQSAIKQNIVLLNAPEGNRDAVAEHAIGLLLNMSKNISSSANEVRGFKWNRESNRGWEIGGKTIGLIGFGNTGTCVARKLSGFDCKTIAYDKYVEINSPYAKQTDLDQLLLESDVISFHIPLSSETKNFLNVDLIRRMKMGVVLINTSRGGICNTFDVWDGITSGKIKTFASDVLEQENLNLLSHEQNKLYSSMLASNQVIITPHIAGWSVESYQKIAQVLSDKIIDYTMKVKNI